jgi:type II secretory pathway predicted ATPase ExeA/Tfp pilus assembly protein PilF
MYLEHFGLNELPFRLMPDPRFYCAKGTQQQVADALSAVLRGGESVVRIIGEVGTGKTLLCRRLARTLACEYRAVELSGSAIGSDGLLRAVLDGLETSDESSGKSSALGLGEPFSRTLGEVLERGPLLPLLAGAVWQAAQLLSAVSGRRSGSSSSLNHPLRPISRHVLDLAEEGLGVLILVDDAHGLSPRSVDELQLLAELEPEPSHRVQIVLLGSPELADQLTKPAAAGLGQRVSRSFEVGPFGRADLEAYVEGRLATAGCERSRLFTPSAIDAVLEATQGIPRLVNLVCHGALTRACTSGDDQVQRHHVRRAAAEADGMCRVVRTRPARAALRATLIGAARILVRAGLRTVQRIRVSVPNRRPVNLKLPSLAPRRRVARAAKWAVVPVVVLLGAASFAGGWAWLRADASAGNPLDAEDRILSEALAALEEDRALELPAVSKRSPLLEPAPFELALPPPLTEEPDLTPESVILPTPSSEAPSGETRTEQTPTTAAEKAPAVARRPPAESSQPVAKAPRAHKPAAPPERRPRRAQPSRARRGSFGKVPHGTDAYAPEAYRRALQYAESGRHEEAADVLRELLEVDPDHHPARESLAAILIRLDRLDEAAGELETGMVLAPGYTSFAKLRAHVLGRRGTTDEALEILKRSPPPLAEDPEYHALLAALYQKQGQHGLAVDLYRAVLNEGPQNAAWWMGFGISLEGEGAPGSALLAYRAAAALTSLDPESQRYVDLRIIALSADGR